VKFRSPRQSGETILIPFSPHFLALENIMIQAQLGRRPWTLWSFILLFLAAAVSVPVMVRPHREEPSVPTRKFPTRQHNGQTEVFVLTPDNPQAKWLPLVAKTDSPLITTVPEELTPGEVAHLNADGTVLVTDSAQAAARIGREVSGVHGWPPATGKWALPD
jgi:hypothetical protein